MDKAIENWVRVTTLDPENIIAHSRLALAHERLGHKPQAVTEYIAVASLVQRTGNAEIFIMKPDGSDVRQLTDNPEPDWQPRWGR